MITQARRTVAVLVLTALTGLAGLCAPPEARAAQVTFISRCTKCAVISGAFTDTMNYTGPNLAPGETKSIQLPDDACIVSAGANWNPFIYQPDCVLKMQGAFAYSDPVSYKPVCGPLVFEIYESCSSPSDCLPLIRRRK